MPRFLKARGQAGRQSHRGPLRGRDGRKVNTGKFKRKGFHDKRRPIPGKRRGQRESRKNISAEELDRDLEGYWNKNDPEILENHLDNDLDAYMQRTEKDEPETVTPATKKS